MASTTHARTLRRNSTDAELRLWSCLRGRQLHGARFRRQQPIGPYIVDFYCAEANLIIEVHGGQHADDGPDRTRWLEDKGYSVIRFWNNDVLANTNGVMELIAAALRR